MKSPKVKHPKSDVSDAVNILDFEPQISSLGDDGEEVRHILDSILGLADGMVESAEQRDWPRMAGLLVERKKLIEQLRTAAAVMKERQPAGDTRDITIAFATLEEIRRRADHLTFILELQKLELLQAMEIMNGRQVLRAYAQ